MARAGLEGFGKSHIQRDSIPRPFSPQTVAKSTALYRPTHGFNTFKKVTKFIQYVRFVGRLYDLCNCLTAGPSGRAV